MPQGRKVAFSGKKKKEQLKNKRTQKTHGSQDDRRNRAPVSAGAGGDAQKKNPNRYALMFHQQSREQIEASKKQSREPYLFLGDEALVYSAEESALEMPKRPEWKPEWSREELEARENRYFREFTDQLLKDEPNASYFEMNLETWRQLWRVLEMSDIVLLIADVRYPPLHLPISIQKHVADLNKRLIIILNKVDLVPAELASDWIQFLERKYPDTKIVAFASYAGCKTIGQNKKRRGKMRSPLQSCLGLFAAVKKIIQEDGIQIDLSTWEHKIREDDIVGDDGESDEELEVGEYVEQSDVLKTSGLREGFLTIGMVGHPNVGKSSLLNALMGKKVVSVSRTPGHTKHFQTMFLTDNLRLCDCPGLVFPTTHPRELQVISGSYPIAQLRTPLSAVQYVAQRIHLERILKLSKVYTDEPAWSAFEIAEAWAIKRGFLTAKTGRPDVNRAANHILRMALDGRTICLSFKPTKDAGSNADAQLVRKVKELSGQKVEPESSDEEKQEESSEESGDSDAGDEVPTVSNKFSMLTEDD